MDEILSTLLSISIAVFAVSSMLSVGLRYSLREIIDPLRDIPGVITAVVANFILMPLLAIAIVRLISLETPMAIGLVIVASAAGAPFLLKLTQTAGEDVAFAASILALLILVTIIYMPLVVPLIAPNASVDAISIAMPLVLTMLVPLCVGFVVEALWPRLAQELLPYVGILSNVAMVVMVVATVLGNLEAVLGVFGTGAILAAILLIGGAFVIGYLLGTFDKREKKVLGLATAQRNFAAATVVATQSFTDPDVLVMTVVCSTIAVVLLLPLARLLGRGAAQTA
jgi:BASS family bile acid:Na+ symporter